MNVQGWATWAVAHPAWVVHLARRAAIESLRKQPSSVPSVHDVPRLQLDEALAVVLRRSIEETRDALAEYAADPLERGIGLLPERWAATDTLAAACYVACRLTRPTLVVEAGTGAGFSATAILKALDANNHGQLISVELPRLGTRDFSYVGSAVPLSLRSRWIVYFGPSLQTLNKIIPRDTTIDVFLHDSDHRYWNQIAEYTFALTHFNECGVLISDDVRGSGFQEVAAAHGLFPALVNQPPKEWPIGLMSLGCRANAVLQER